MNRIRIQNIRAVFLPLNFYEKYKYLGSIPWGKEGDLFKAIYPLVLAMDYEAKPKMCPRWFLRFLHLFGSDNSIVRVRNRRLHSLEKKLTKGIMFTDWKTKWSDYDLRISIYAPEHLQELASAIEERFYSRGRQEELVKEIKALDPLAPIMWGSISRLEKQLEKLEKAMKNFRDELRLITNNTEWTDNEKFEAIDELHERYVAKKVKLFTIPVVREEQPIEEIEMNVISFDGRVFETDLYCFEATRLYNDDGIPYEGCDIEFTDKRVKPWKVDNLDNPIWFIGVLENNPESMDEAREMLCEQGIAEFRAFVRDLINVGWVNKN
jgi:hypothetical protein